MTLFLMVVFYTVCLKKYQEYTGTSLTVGSSTTPASANAADCRKKCSETVCYAYKWGRTSPTAADVCTLYSTVGQGKMKVSVGETLYKMYRDCEGVYFFVLFCSPNYLILRTFFHKSHYINYTFTLEIISKFGEIR